MDPMPHDRPWPPTQLRRFERLVETSTSPAIVMTDAGRAYAKVMGNPEGPHTLACELVGMSLAAMLGLRTPDHAIVEITEADVFRLANGQECQLGPAFLTRALDARPWDGTAEDLDGLENQEDISRLVVLDTWLLNPDRMPRCPAAAAPPHPAARDRRPNRDNVLLATPADLPPNRTELIAIDFTHALTIGRDLTKHMDSIDRIRDEGVYGLFDEFRPLVREAVVSDMAERLRAITEKEVGAVLARIPEAWAVDDEAKVALLTFLVQRARWLADRIVGCLAPLSWKRVGLPLWDGGESR